MKIVLYTCVTGGYDTIKPPASIDSRLDYHCFTDDPAAVPAPWQAHPITLPGLGDKARNRFVKMHPHLLPELDGHDVSVYVDGSIRVTGDVFELAMSCVEKGGDMFLYEHPFRDCVYDEAVACARFGHDSLLTIARQMRRYRAAGFPPHVGLFECGVLVRRPTPAVAAAMTDWWHEYRHGAHRDQLALTYVAWRRGFRVGSLGLSDPRFEHRYFELMAHERRPTRASAVLHSWVNKAAMAVLPKRVLFDHD